MVRLYTMQLSTGAVATAATKIFTVWRDRPHTFWLDSSWGVERLGRFSFLGTDPYATLRVDGDKARYTSAAGERCWRAEPFEAVAQVAAPVMARPFPDAFPVPFAGGLVGYIGYGARDIAGAPDAAGPSGAVPGASMPDLAFGLYDAIVCIDHLQGCLHLVSNGLPLSGRAGSKRAGERLAWLRSEVEAALRVGATDGLTASPSIGPVNSCGFQSDWRHTAGHVGARLRSTFTPEEYVQQVERALKLIRAGKLDQVNLSQRFSMSTASSPSELYLRLRETSPAPFAAWLDVDGAAVLSSSPERFLRIVGDEIEMRPIKGTRPRGADAVTDARLRAALLASAKDEAEHEMIVQLERTQLERLCVDGTVNVPERMVCEEYATVFHLVSTVTGQLTPDANRVETVRSLFPGGSITGRPKERAIQLIGELEPVPRGVYTGSIGYFGIGGHLDLNVAIRTIVLQDGQAHFHVGGAVVADSDAEDEYEETLDKAEGIMRALLASER